jgi:putative ABC transport system permease protein
MILGFLYKTKKMGVLGDTEEEYRMIRSDQGRISADMWYLWQILKPLPFFIRHSLYGRFVMFETYIKIAFRNIKGHKGYSFLNISGLAALTIALLSVSYQSIKAATADPVDSLRDE